MRRARCDRLLGKAAKLVGKAMVYVAVMGLIRPDDEDDVAKELADVVVTAMVALHDWVPSPKLFMEKHLEGLLKRIKEEGS